MRLQMLSFTIVSLLVAACATSPEPPPLPWGPGVVDANGCPRELGTVVLGHSPALVRQGGEVAVGAAIVNGPFGATELPTHCLENLQVGPADAGTIHADGRLILRPDVAAGVVVTVSARYADQTAATQFRVVGRDEVVLTGTWRQDSVKCDPGRAPGEPVREFKVTDDGRFNVTYLPFESYVDIWGGASFDPATGAVALSPTGGNFNPPIFDGEGQARLEGERRLILEGVYLGDRNERNFQPRVDEKGYTVFAPDGTVIVDRPVCTYEFVR